MKFEFELNRAISKSKDVTLEEKIHLSYIFEDYESEINNH